LKAERKKGTVYNKRELDVDSITLLYEKSKEYSRYIINLLRNCIS
jgi:hypothetical protein